MVDRGAFALVPDDIVGLFRRLNGAAMYDILDTLDALLKEKNFYPNSGTYRTQLDSAGIFVQRLEVAMSAVMAKNARQTSYDQFSGTFAYILAMLPEDQRANIAKYFTGSSGTQSLPQSRLVAQYLEWGKWALFATRAALDRGALNRASDWADGGVIATIKARNAEAGRNYWTPEDLAAIAMNARGGNCGEFSATAYTLLKRRGYRPLNWYTLLNGDHMFVLIGAGPVGLIDGRDVARWGNSVVVCDAWNRDAYVASEIPKRLPCQHGAFRANSVGYIGY